MAPSSIAPFHKERGASQTIVPSTGDALSRLVSELLLAHHPDFGSLLMPKTIGETALLRIPTSKA
jgi:hypothetical protein